MAGLSKGVTSLWERIKAHTHERVQNPQEGDHFTEHMGSVALITKRCGDAVWVARPQYDKSEWGKPELMSVEDWIKWASYGSIPGYWLECIPPSGDGK